MRERDIVPYQLFNGAEIQFLPLYLCHQTQTVYLGCRNARCMQDGGARKKESLKIIVTQLTCSSKLRLSLDVPGYHSDLEFLVAACRHLLVGGRGLVEIDFQNVHEWGQCFCPRIVQTVLECQCVSLLLQF